MRSLHCFIQAAVILAATSTIECATSQNVRQKSRRTEINRIMGYLPTLDVSDQAIIDLDQQKMEELVLSRKLLIAKEVYRKGGYSMSYAQMYLHNPVGSGNYPKGSKVYGVNDDAAPIAGRTMEDVSWNATTYSNTTNHTITLKVLYDIDSEYSPVCSVGALYLSSSAELQNCT